MERGYNSFWQEATPFLLGKEGGGFRIFANNPEAYLAVGEALAFGLPKIDDALEVLAAVAKLKDHDDTLYAAEQAEHLKGAIMRYGIAQRRNVSSTPPNSWPIFIACSPELTSDDSQPNF
jgi:hypothetical protein